MTKDEEDWLDDFCEAAQASARQNALAAEKDYAAKLKALTPRLTRAVALDPAGDLAQRLAASEALAGRRKFDAASDALDEAYALTAGLLTAAAEAAEAAALAATPAPDPVEVAAPEAVDPSTPEATEWTASDADEGENVAPEAPAEETPLPAVSEEEDLESMFGDLSEELATDQESAPVEGAAEELPAEAFLDDVANSAGEEIPAAAPAEETPAEEEDLGHSMDDALADLLAAEEPATPGPDAAATEDFPFPDEPPAEEPGTTGAAPAEEFPSDEEDVSQKKSQP